MTMWQVHSDRELLDALRIQIMEQTGNYTEDAFILRGLWNLRLRYRPSYDERMFRYHVLICQSSGEGICYSDQPIDASDALLGADARRLPEAPFEVMLSALDSAFAGVPVPACQQIEISGGHTAKAVKRAAVVADVVDDIISTRTKKKYRVLNIGAIGHIICELQHRSYEVAATDLDSQVVGHSLHGVCVRSGTQNMDIIPDCDIVVASGMTLATQSLVAIAAKCRECRIPCVVVAETGAHLAPHYRAILGLAAVVSEPFPFYTFSGRSLISVYADSLTVGGSR